MRTPRVWSIARIVAGGAESLDRKIASTRPSSNACRATSPSTGSSGVGRYLRESFQACSGGGSGNQKVPTIHVVHAATDRTRDDRVQATSADVIDLNAMAGDDTVGHTIRVELPQHLRTLAGIRSHELPVHIESEPTIRNVLDALEAEHPMLAGTIRDHEKGERRAFLRFFACMQDISFEPMDALLPQAVIEGREPLIILGAVAGGKLELASIR